MIAGLLLAAGASRRFGSQKLLAPIAGVPVVRRAAEQLIATSLDEIFVVLGSHADAIRGALAGLAVRIVTNADYSAGMSTSVRAGLAALPPTTEAVVIALADQPTVGPSIVDRLVDHFRAHRSPIVAPLYFGGVRGNPVLFERALFDELGDVVGDEGGRAVVARDLARVALVQFDQVMPADIDVPEDLGGNGLRTT